MTGSIVPVAAQLVSCVSAKTCYREPASERTMIQTGKISRRKMVNEEMNEGKQRERGRENHRERRREQERLEKEREEGRDGGRETQGGRVANQFYFTLSLAHCMVCSMLAGKDLSVQ